jgi:hypothetical protein
MARLNAEPLLLCSACNDIFGETTLATLPALYVLAAEYQAATEKLADLDLPEEVVRDTLESLAFPLEQKAANVAMFVRNLEATAEAIKVAESEMAARRRAIENRVASLRHYLHINMQACGITKIDNPHLRLVLRSNPPAVVIDSERLIPAEFMRQPEPPPPAPDKGRIAKALKSGLEVPGAHLQNSTRLEIR